MEDKYCRCVFETRGRANNPYAVCTASIFNRRGMKGPGATRCFYTPDFIERQPPQTLQAFLNEKGYNTSRMTHDQLIDATLDYLEDVGELQPALPALY